MSPVLPLHPHLDHLKKQAKALLKAQCAGDALACEPLRQLHRFADVGDAEILAASVQLHEVQFALALDYGFPSWERLQAFVGGQEPLPIPAMDFAGVVIRGNGCNDDTFSLVMDEVCTLLNRPVPYDLLVFLAGNGFAPAVRECEPSRHWWHVQNQAKNLNLVAQTVGLSTRLLPKIDCGTLPPYPEDNEARDQWFNEYYRLPSVPAIAQALARGDVVITDRDWDWRHYHNGWVGWGILTEARADGTILGACLNGRRDNPMVFPAQCFALSPAKPSLSPQETLRETLQRAVQRIRATGRFTRSLPANPDFFGLTGVDRIIEEMRTVPGFCAECQEHEDGWKCARENAILTVKGARVVAAVLHTRLDEFFPGTMPATARKPLQTAADCYTRITERLQSATANDGEGSYKAICPDLARQQAHVEEVLLPVKADLTKAVTAIERALDVMKV